MRLEWGPATGRASFVVISGLAGTPVLIEMDLMVPLHMQIDAARCTVVPRPISNLQENKEPSGEPKPTHTSVSSLANSRWASPVVMLWKKNDRLCLCVVFRQLNASTIKNAHPLLCIEDFSDALHGA